MFLRLDPRRLCALLALPFCALAALPASAGPAVLLHLQEASGSAGPACAPGRGIATPFDLPCSAYRIAGRTGSSYFAYLVVAGADPQGGVAGLSSGIDYEPADGQGVDVSQWTLCADLEFPNAGPFGDWPAAGGGNRITWDHSVNCQDRTVPGADAEGAYAVAGAFYVYAYAADLLRVTTNNNLVSGPELEVVDCQGGVFDPPLSAMGGVRFSPAGDEPGCNPCLGPCPGQLPPHGVADVGTLDFGSINPGESRDLSFTYTNQGEGYASGDVSVRMCDSFSILSGGGAFALRRGENRTTVVRFAPDYSGARSCRIMPGPSCDDVILTGYGIPAGGEPECVVARTWNDFRTLRVGEQTYRDVYVTNIGTGILVGDASIDCDSFWFRFGQDYRLGSHEYAFIRIMFEPTRPGLHVCRLDLGPWCDDVELVGFALPRGDADTSGVESPVIPVAFDLRPNLCPNVLNPEGEEVFHAALLGTPTFDVETVEPGSVRLLETLEPLRTEIRDVGRAPATGGCDCPPSGRDGIPDLVLVVRSSDVFTAIGPRHRGESISIELTGTSRDGDPLVGVDCLEVIGPRLAHPPTFPQPDITVLSSPQDPAQRVRIDLPAPARVSLSVFDVTGRRVAFLDRGPRPAGLQDLIWDRGDLASGIYILRVEAGDTSFRGKVAILR